MASFGFPAVTMGVDDKSNWVAADNADAIYVISLALTVLLPVAPLLLTTFSVEQLVDRLLKVVL